MSSDARLPAHLRGSPFPRPPAMLTRGIPADGAEAALAGAALRNALREFLHTGPRTGYDPQETDRWENEGGSPGRAASPAPDGRSVGEGGRRAWAAHEAAHDAVAAAVRAYTRVLRRDGASLAASLIAVDATVRGGTASHPRGEACDAVQRDAVRSCLEAYHGP